MALSIKNPEADRLARELARRQDRSITDAVVAALKAELARERRRSRAPGMAKRLLAIADSYCALPEHGTRSEDEILGYDERGMPS